jgi:hypothetical protein
MKARADSSVGKDRIPEQMIFLPVKKAPQPSPPLPSPGRNFKHKPSWDKNIVLREYETCQFLKAF